MGWLGWIGCFAYFVLSEVFSIEQLLRRASWSSRTITVPELNLLLILCIALSWVGFSKRGIEMKHFRGIIAVLLFVPLCLCFQLRFKGRQEVKVSLSTRYIAGIRSWAGCSRTELRFSDTNENEESHTSDNTETSSEPENNDGSDTTQLSGETELDERLAESIPKDPKMVAIKELEMKLREELNSAESLLRAERIQLSKTKESVFESGKNGYFMVQAQVNDFVVSHLNCYVHHLS